MRYCGPDGGALLIEPLEPFAAILHRPSGTTHLLAEPAPQILAALTGATLDLDALWAKLAEAHDLADADRAVLVQRLDELVQAGLVDAQ